MTLPAQFSQTTRSLSGDNGRLTKIVWAIACLFLAGWVVWFWFGKVTVYAVSEHAHLEVSQAPHFVDALIASQIVSTSLSIGREVKEGEILMQLDDRAETSKLGEQTARLAALETQIAAMDKEIEAKERGKIADQESSAAALNVARFRNEEASLATDYAKGNEERIGQLVNKGGLAKVDALKATSETAKLLASQNATAAEIQRIELEARTRADVAEADIEALKSTVAGLRGEKATAIATLEQLKLSIAKHVIRAPVSGKLGDIVQTRVGAYVAEGQRLATIVPEGDVIAIAEFNPTTTLGRVQAGQKAQLRLDSFPWAQYGSVPAVVSGVASEIRDKLVRVEFRLGPPPATGISLQHGLPGSIEVAVEDVSPAALVLRSAGLLLSRNKPATAEVASVTP